MSLGKTKQPTDAKTPRIFLKSGEKFYGRRVKTEKSSLFLLKCNHCSKMNLVGMHNSDYIGIGEDPWYN